MLEVDALSEALKREFPSPAQRPSPVDTAPPPIRVIDCVLSLRRPYLSVVEPRVLAFLCDNPQMVSCEQLRDTMVAEGPGEFLQRRLRMNYPQRAEILLNVTRRLIDIQAGVEGATELERLETWARASRAEDHATFGVKGFGVAGFQYLRLLFGANTTKPDVHICRFVEGVLGRSVAELEALHLLERAAAQAGFPLRAVDSAVWQRGALR